MKNFFARAQTDDMRPLRDELHALIVRLDRIAGVLEMLSTRTDTALGTLPEAVVLRVLAEVRAASATAKAAAWATIKRHLIEHLFKWLWRIGLGYAGAQLLLHTSLLVDAVKDLFE
jgi:hypothetical protein